MRCKGQKVEDSSLKPVVRQWGIYLGSKRCWDCRFYFSQETSELNLSRSLE